MKADKFLDIPCEDRIIIREKLDNIFSNRSEDCLSVVQLGASVGGTPNPSRGDWCPSISDPVWKFLKGNKKWTGFLFEPHLKSYLICKEFYKDDDNVLVFPVAVSSRDDLFVDFYERNVCTMSSLHDGTRKEGQFAGAVKSTHRIVNVNINKVISQVKPDWLQIDIEGEDVFAVRSILDNSNNLPPVLSFEWCLAKEADIQYVYDKALSLGYSLYFKSHWDVIFTKTIK